MHKYLISLAALAAGTAVAAQQSPQDPTDPKATVPAARYRSVFEGYRPYVEQKIAPWRESNDAVRGGADPHAGHGTPAPEERDKPSGASPNARKHGGHK